MFFFVNYLLVSIVSKVLESLDEEKEIAYIPKKEIKRYFDGNAYAKKYWYLNTRVIDIF